MLEKGMQSQWHPTPLTLFSLGKRRNLGASRVTKSFNPHTKRERGKSSVVRLGRHKTSLCIGGASGNPALVSNLSFWIYLLCLSILPAAHVWSAEPPPPTQVTYEKQIRPILESKCFSCHGAEKVKSGLRLDSRQQLLRGGESGKVLVPGDVEASYLFELIESGEMPPEGEEALTRKEVAEIRRWIEGGAKFVDGTTEDRVDFHEVLPILLLRCVACHGAQLKEAELDLRSFTSIQKGGKSGAVIAAGEPGNSLLMKRIHAGEMPPKRRLVESSSKPIEESEIRRIERWIQQGAQPPAKRSRGAQGTSRPTTDDPHWAFHPPQKGSLPLVTNNMIVRNPIDLFIQRTLEQRDLTLSASADPITLMRRAYFDLTGLPPTEEEVQRYLASVDADPNTAYEQLIDQLLDSPRYGERWGRYWLDLAGYSDSEGVQHSDTVRANAWRYRDYVIRSFNADKPYDRFVTEQIAGDELADFRDQEAITEEVYDNLVATGFLRMAPDGTWANITNFVPDRLDVIDDEIEILSSSMMGLTFKCARCHSHKFDPISHSNYYGLLAIFKGALDEHDWLKPYGATQFSSGPFGRRQLTSVATTEWRAWEENNKSIDQEIEQLKNRLAQLKEKAAKASATSDAKAGDEKPGDEKPGDEKPGDEKSAEEVAKAAEEELKKAEAEIHEHIKKSEGKRKSQPLVRALWDRGSPSPTFLLRRGNYLTPGELVEPHVPASIKVSQPFEIRQPPRADSTGRRLAFARWLTQPDHPLTSRVLVNRVWKNHFGQGIVRSIDNFGKSGDSPSHPELLDWLAVRFVQDGWHIKDLHRLIMLSSTYRQSSQVTPDREERDPENRWLSRMPLRRLDAESLRDTLLFVSGRLNLEPFGPPDSVTARGDGLVTSVGTERGWRRSIYVQQRRTQILTILENFDLPRMGPNCTDRPESTVAPQALHLLNNQMVHELSQHFADRVLAPGAPDKNKDTLEDALAKVHVLALSRSPTEDEMSLATKIVQQLQAAWEAKAPAAERDKAQSRAVANYCHAIMNSAAFLYID